LFFPFITFFSKALLKIFPDTNKKLALYIHNSVADVPEAGLESLKLECKNLITQVMRFHLFILSIDETLVFSQKQKPKINHDKPDEFYENIKLLQSEIISFSIKLSNEQLTETESLKLNRLMHAGRLLIHSAKQIKDIKKDFDDFENSENAYLSEIYGQ